VREGRVGYLRVHIAPDFYGHETAFADEGEGGLSFDDVTAVQCIQFPVIKKQEFRVYLSTAMAGKLRLGCSCAWTKAHNDISSVAAMPPEH
jgi:hypothetical protein